MVRNVFLCLWPIEVEPFLVKPNRRLGDYVSKTKVIEVNLSRSLKISKDDLPVILICFGITLTISSLVMTFSTTNFPLVKMLFS